MTVDLLVWLLCCHLLPAVAFSAAYLCCVMLERRLDELSLLRPVEILLRLHRRSFVDPSRSLMIDFEAG